MIGKSILVGVALLVGLAVGTEVFAYLTRLAPELGAPLYRSGRVALYGPWQLGVWAWQWGALIPRAFVLPGMGLGLGMCLVLVSCWPRSRQASKVQAHWATKRELQQAECLSDGGIVLGRLS